MKECRTDRVLGWLVGEGAGCLGGRAEPVVNCCVGHTWRCWESVCIGWEQLVMLLVALCSAPDTGDHPGDPTGPASG